MTDKPTPTTDLLKRCAEIHEWRSTGVLSGEALRDYAKRKWPDRHDTLQARWVAREGLPLRNQIRSSGCLRRTKRQGTKP